VGINRVVTDDARSNYCAGSCSQNVSTNELNNIFSGSVVGVAAQVEVSFTSKIHYHYGPTRGMHWLAP